MRLYQVHFRAESGMSVGCEYFTSHVKAKKAVAAWMNRAGEVDDPSATIQAITVAPSKQGILDALRLRTIISHQLPSAANFTDVDRSEGLSPDLGQVAEQVPRLTEAEFQGFSVEFLIASLRVRVQEAHVSDQALEDHRIPAIESPAHRFPVQDLVIHGALQWQVRTTRPGRQRPGVDHEHRLLFARGGDPQSVNREQSSTEQYEVKRRPASRHQGVYQTGDVQARSLIVGGT